MDDTWIDRDGDVIPRRDYNEMPLDAAITITIGERRKYYASENVRYAELQCGADSWIKIHESSQRAEETPLLNLVNAARFISRDVREDVWTPAEWECAKTAVDELRKREGTW